MINFFMKMIFYEFFMNMKIFSSEILLD